MTPREDILCVLRRLRAFIDRDEVRFLRGVPSADGPTLKQINDPEDPVWKELAAIDHEIARVTE